MAFERRNPFGNPSQAHPATSWEAEIDKLMEQQLSTEFRRTKEELRPVKQILDENQPFIFLATPNILVGAKDNVGNFQPTVLEPMRCGIRDLFCGTCRRLDGK